MIGTLARLIFALLLVIPVYDANASIPEFFQQLYSDFEPEYSSLRASEFHLFCASHGLDSLSATNRRSFLQIHFLHDLFTCTSAANCARGGILQIPYFWHWVDPNPRHSILLLPDSTLLKDLNPTPPYTHYKTYADIDRFPELYFDDLIAEKPRYSHPECGSFFTFGWCSEREMSFLALLISLGYRGKIQQNGIHTYTVLWCEFDKSNGENVVLSVSVDNTFDSISWQTVPPTVTLDTWLRDIGAGTEIAWYNRIARSQEQLEKLRNMLVSNVARERIRDQVRKTNSLH